MSLVNSYKVEIQNLDYFSVSEASKEWEGRRLSSQRFAHLKKTHTQSKNIGRKLLTSLSIIHTKVDLENNRGMQTRQLARRIHRQEHWKSFVAVSFWKCKHCYAACSLNVVNAWHMSTWYTNPLDVSFSLFCWYTNSLGFQRFEYENYTKYSDFSCFLQQILLFN